MWNSFKNYMRKFMELPGPIKSKAKIFDIEKVGKATKVRLDVNVNAFN